MKKLKEWSDDIGDLLGVLPSKTDRFVKGIRDEFQMEVVKILGDYSNVCAIEHSTTLDIINDIKRLRENESNKRMV